MADYTEPGPSSEFMKEHERTWLGFLKLIKWLIIGSILLLAILLIWRTNG